MTGRRLAAAIPLLAVAVLGACSGPPAPPAGPAAAGGPVVAAEALRGQVEALASLTLVLHNETDETFVLADQHGDGTWNELMPSILGARQSVRGVINSWELTGASIHGKYQLRTSGPDGAGALDGAYLAFDAMVPLAGSNALYADVYDPTLMHPWGPGADPRFVVVTDMPGGYTPTAAITIRRSTP